MESGLKVIRKLQNMSRVLTALSHVKQFIVKEISYEGGGEPTLGPCTPLRSKWN